MEYDDAELVGEMTVVFVLAANMESEEISVGSDIANGVNAVIAALKAKREKEVMPNAAETGPAKHKTSPR